MKKSEKKLKLYQILEFGITILMFLNLLFTIWVCFDVYVRVFRYAHLILISGSLVVLCGISIIQLKKFNMKIKAIIIIEKVKKAVEIFNEQQMVI